MINRMSQQARRVAGDFAATFAATFFNGVSGVAANLIAGPARVAAKATPKAAIVASLVVLASCQSSNLGINSDTANNGQPVAPVLTPNPKGEVFGQGNVRVALLIPKTAPGNAAAAANEIRNGALLAMQDFGQNTLQLVIKDTTGQPAKAQEAANEAVSEGSSAILGPLFASSVSSASGVAQPAGRTMLAFSTDSSVARRGVYLLSYVPQEDVRRIINYALSQGKRSFVAFLPRNAEGAIRESVLKQVAGSAGANVQVVKYERSGPGIEEAAKAGATLIAGADAIYIPEGGPIPNAVLTTLRRNGADLTGKQVLGSGTWESVKTTDTSVAGALYPGRDVTRFNDFASRYQATYNAQPGVLAAVGYDAVTLASELVRQNGTNAFSSNIIENRRGFAGVNGVFRLKSDGTSERGLAIYQITGGKGQLLSPAPVSFNASGT